MIFHVFLKGLGVLARGPLFASLLATVTFAQVSAVSVQGIVTGEGTSQVEGAQVILSPLVGSKTATPVSATSDDKGKIELKNVPPGIYSVCVIGAKGDLLNPCEWSPAALRFTVEAGKAPNALAAHLSKGVSLRISVEDPDHVVPTPFDATLTGAFFEAGVWSSDGSFHSARYVSSDKKGHEYELLIPMDIDLKLWISAVGFQVIDKKGARVDRVRGAVIRADRGRAPVRLEYLAIKAK